MRKLLFFTALQLFFLVPVHGQTSPAPAQDPKSHAERFSTPESRANRIEAETTEKLKKDPNNAELINDRALARMRLQKFNEAYEDLKKAVDLSPKNAGYLANLGYVLWKIGRGQDAIAAEREALKLDENNYTANYQLGRFLLRTGDRKNLPEAAEKLRKALEIDPRLYEVRFELIAAYRELGDLASAINQLSLLQDAKPSDARVVYVDALLSVDKGDMRTAVERFRNALTKDPNLYGAWQDLGLAYVKVGWWQEAADTFAELAKRQQSSVEAAYFGAVALYNLKKTKEAEAEARRALRINIGFADAHALLGVILASKGDADAEAIESLSQAVALQPNNFDAVFYLGRVQYTRREFAAALKNFEAAVKLSPSNLEARFFYGTVLEAAGDSDKALAEYQEIVKADEKSFFGQVGMGALLVKQGKLDEAVASLNRALSLEGQSFEANWMLGRAYILQEKFTEAAGALERAIVLQPKRTDARYQYAIALRGLGRAEDAKREFDLVEKMNREFREGKEN